MHVEQGERRAFLPSFAGFLESLGARVVIEHGYGSGMGFSEKDYLEQASSARFSENQETYQQDYVIILRCPSQGELRQMPQEACLLSMLHYPTNPCRTAFIRSLGLKAISLDSIADDGERRLVENMRAVAWNGLEVAFRELAAQYPEPRFVSTQRDNILVTLMGSGQVGTEVVPAAIRYADQDRWHRLAAAGVPGVRVQVVDYDTTGIERIMSQLLSGTDILVDATQRPDPGRAIIPNHWIDWLPQHAVLLDLTVDPYDHSVPPKSVKGIEGMPHGNLDHYVFKPEDELWDQTVPDQIPSSHRRTAVSCYSWPGIHPRACMAHYGSQLEPLLSVLLRSGYESLSIEGDYAQRALYRAAIDRVIGDFS
jgi:alanine dehydrogenase